MKTYYFEHDFQVEVNDDGRVNINDLMTLESIRMSKEEVKKLMEILNGID